MDEGQGEKRDDEEGGTRRKEGRGERSDMEEGAMRRVKKLKMKKWLEDASLTSGSCFYLKKMNFFLQAHRG